MRQLGRRLERAVHVERPEVREVPPARRAELLLEVGQRHRVLRGRWLAYPRTVEGLLSAWFAAHGRDLPWRHTRDPYAILVSEVMLQQTQVERVVPRYLAWLERWPTVEALASASTADVIREWQGLGYNRRAVNLQRAAREVARDGWPDDLTALPGIGPYTAAAVRCFALGEDVLPVDVNVERVQRRTGHAFSAVIGAGADGSRRDRLPRARPALRRLPARGGVPVARDPRGAGTQAGAVRGLVPPASRDSAAARRRCSARARSSSTTRPSARSSGTGSSSWPRESSPCRCRGEACLAIARGLVEAQGGRIWAENREGGGARVCFTIPAS